MSARDPPERFRHGLRRPHPARHVDASARPFGRLPLARLLGRLSRERSSAACSTACSSPMCSASTTSIRARRTRRCVARVQVPLIDPDAAGSGDGARHRAPGLRRDLQSHLRAALSVRAPHVHARSSDAAAGSAGTSSPATWTAPRARWGFDEQMAHDDRYDLADEYMELVYTLWEGSWEDGAVLRDRAAGVYADPARVHRRAARRAAIPARRLAICASRRRNARRCCIRPAPPIAAARSPARTPSASSSTAAQGRMWRGSSPTCGRGRRRGRCAVSSAPRDRRTGGRAGGAGAVRRISPLCQRGRCAGACRRLARDRLRAIRDRRADRRQPGNAIHSNVEAMGSQWTKRKLIDRSCWAAASRRLSARRRSRRRADPGSRRPMWMASTCPAPWCRSAFRILSILVVPVLQERGLYKRAYGAGTYREKLFGTARLQAPHPAALRA